MKTFETVLVNTFFTKEQLSDMQDLINESLGNYLDELQDNPFADDNRKEDLISEFDFKQILINNGFDVQENEINILIDALIYYNI
jgi:hypothetical protein